MTPRRSLTIMVIDTAGIGYSLLMKNVLGSSAHGKVQATSKKFGEVFMLESNHGRVCYRMQFVMTSVAYLDGPAMRLSMSSCDGFVLIYYAENQASFDAVVRVRNIIQRERASGLNVPMFIVGNNDNAKAGRKKARKTNSESFELDAWEWRSDYAYREVCMADRKQVRRLFKDVVQGCVMAHDLRFSPVVQQQRTTVPGLKLCQCLTME